MSLKTTVTGLQGDGDVGEAPLQFCAETRAMQKEKKAELRGVKRAQRTARPILHDDGELLTDEKQYIDHISLLER